MSKKRPADDDIDWSSVLFDDLDNDLMEVADANCNTDTSNVMDNNPLSVKVSKPKDVEVITIEDYDEEDEQLLQAIILSLQDISRSKTGSYVSSNLPDVQLLPSTSSAFVPSKVPDVELLPSMNSGFVSSKMPDIQLLPSTSSAFVPPTSSKMSDADLAAVMGALEELEHNFNTKKTVEDEETLRTIKIMEIADQLELEDQQKLESYNPTHAAIIRSLPLVHPDLELLDPNPDIFQLFREFDARFFQSFLTQKALRLDWAKNFYSVAGAYYPLKDGVPTILLSANLLTLRPRRDLVETLIHEMIHAYIDLKGLHDTGDHGPVFHQHMKRINETSGTNITVYHEFHDEVSYLRKYIWRCTGSICQALHPYCGYISLPTKRRPSKWDKAYRIHLERGCSGTFEQVSNNFQDDNKEKEKKKIEKEKEKEKKKMEREKEKEKKIMEKRKEKESAKSNKSKE